MSAFALTRRGSMSRGVTLIETIAAIMILAVAIPPLVWATREAQHQRVAPVQTSTARWLAAEKLEDVLADWNSPARGYDWISEGEYPAEAPVEEFKGFHRRVRIQETAPDPTSAGTGTKVITVEIEWTDGRGNARSLELSGVITDLRE